MLFRQIMHFEGLTYSVVVVFFSSSRDQRLLGLQYVKKAHKKQFLL